MPIVKIILLLTISLFFLVFFTVLFPIICIALVIAKKSLTIKNVWNNMIHVYATFACFIFPLCFYGIPGLIQLRRNKGIRAKSEDEKKPFDLSKLQKGDVVLAGYNNWNHAHLIQLSNVLSSGLHNRYWTHALIYTGEEKVIGADMGQDVVEQNILSDYVEKGRKLTVLRHQNISDNEINDVVQFCENLVSSHTKYDFWGLCFYVLAVTVPPSCSSWLDEDFAEDLFNVKQSYFCSELVAEAFQVAGVSCFSKKIKPWRVSPVDFYENYFFKRIY